jgi:hypothetical protein
VTPRRPRRAGDRQRDAERRPAEERERRRRGEHASQRDTDVDHGAGEDHGDPGAGHQHPDRDGDRRRDAGDELPAGERVAEQHLEAAGLLLAGDLVGDAEGRVDGDEEREHRREPAVDEPLRRGEVVGADERTHRLGEVRHELLEPARVPHRRPREDREGAQGRERDGPDEERPAVDAEALRRDHERLHGRSPPASSSSSS